MFDSTVFTVPLPPSILRSAELCPLSFYPSGGTNARLDGASSLH
jgi:hypothetical protein